MHTRLPVLPSESVVVQETSETRPILETRELTRVVNQVALVNNISMQVSAGEIVVLVGPSGGGKSSFLRLLNRLDEPTYGTVFLEGTDYQNIPSPSLRQQVGMVMQQAYLFSGTVEDNLQFGPSQRNQRLSAEEVELLLQQVGLSGYQERSVQKLSGGESQRVSLARTLANPLKVLLLDEPTSALDEKVRLDIETVVRARVQAQKLAVLWVTHDLEQARRVAHRVMFLQQGQLVQIGEPHEVLRAVSTFS